MDEQTVDNWIASYIKAWKSPGTGLLQSIFTDEVTYVPSPFRQPIKGQEALAAFWEESREGPHETFSFKHQPVAIEGNTAVVRVDVFYPDDSQLWKDLWVMQFDADGRCFYFEEWPFSPTQPDGHKQDK